MSDAEGSATPEEQLDELIAAVRSAPVEDDAPPVEDPAGPGEAEAVTEIAEPEPVEPQGDAQPEAAESEADAQLEAVESEADAPVGDAVPTGPASSGLTWTPFALYLVAWLALCGACVYLLRGATVDAPARWLPEYPVLVWAGVSLAAAGPVLSFIVWVVANVRRSAEARRGLLASAFLRGALMTLTGVVLWLGTLYAIEILTARGVL